jgi:tetratricopeptide (TPR) repeat protein
MYDKVKNKIHLKFALRASYIRDIHQQLKHDQYKRPIQVYRGQLISSDELDTLKQSVGEFVSMNSFLSTSVDRKLALFFLGDRTVTYDLERILFEINVDPCNVITTPFAEVSKHSNFPDESEILFMAGSIFRLTEIRRDNDSNWIIRMILCGANEHGLHRLLEHMRKGYGSGQDSTLLSFGSAMWRMGKLNEAEKYYRRLLKELPSDDSSLGYLYHNLGIVMNDKGDYDISLQWYQKSLDIRMRTRPSDYVNIGNTHNCIGNVDRKKGDHVRALESYNKAVSLFKQAGDEKHPAMAHLYNNIGIVYQKQKKYSKALTCYEKALAIQQKHLPSDHSDLAMSYNNIGCAHYSLDQNDYAFKYYNLSLEIYLKSFPPQHPDIAAIYQNIGLVYKRKGEFGQALTYLQKAATINRHLLPPHHADLLRIEETIRRVSAKLK